MSRGCKLEQAARRPVRRWATIACACVLIVLGLTLGPAGKLFAGDEPQSPAPETGAAPAPTTTGPPLIYVLRVDREIDHVTEVYVRRGIREAEAANASLIVLELDTFGGLVTSGINISEMLIATRIPTVAWVHSKGISGGAMLTYACNDIVVSRGAGFGGAVVIAAGPAGEPTSVGEKYTRITAQHMRANAEANGHYAEFAVAMTDLDVEILYDDYARQMARRKVWLGVPKQYRDEGPEQGGPVNYTVGSVPGQPSWEEYGNEYIVKKGQVLHFTSREALFLRVAIGRAAVVDQAPGMADHVEAITDIEKFAPLRGARIVRVSSSWSEVISAFLGTPLVSLLLLLGAIVGIGTEIKVPGFGFPGVLGFTCLALLFFGQLGAGAARWTDLILIVIGIILLGVELFVIPGFGIVGILGIVAIVAGLFKMLVKNPPEGLPPLPGDLFRGLLLLGGAIVGSVIALFVLYYFVLPRTQFLGALVLTTQQRHEAGFHASEGSELAEPEKLIGRIGVAKSKLRPAGRAVFDGEPYDVVSRGDYIDPGAEVEIVEVESNRIVVREYRPPQGQAPTQEA